MKLEIDVPKETYELADGLVKLIDAVRTALKDGWQPGTDLPAIATSAFAILPPAIAGFDQLGAEFKADKGKLVLALAVAVDKIV
jgi:hypothetical protein